MFKLVVVVAALARADEALERHRAEVLASAVYASPEDEGAVAVAVAARDGSACGSAAAAIDVVSQAGAGPALAVAPRGAIVVAGVLFEATEDVVAAVPPLVLSSASYSDAAYVNVSLALAFGSLAVDGVEGLELWSANASHLGFAGSRAAADAALANLVYAPPPDFFGEWAPTAAVVDASDAVAVEVAHACYALAMTASTLGAWVVTVAGGHGPRPAITAGDDGLVDGLELALLPDEATEAAARSYAILGAAAVPAAVDEVQTLRCAREVGDDADDGFRFVFRGLKSPKIRMDAAPVPELLPACPAADACRGDGSSLAEILEAWLRGAGVLGAGGSLAVASTGTMLCSDPVKGGAALPNAVGGFEARGWGLGAPTLTNITFLGGGPGGVGGDVDEFLVVKRAASNGTILELAETTRGSAAAVGEVQVVETALALNSTYTNGTAANESSVRGVFELGFRGATTAPLSHDASAGELAAALNALDTVGGGVTASRRPTADGRGYKTRDAVPGQCTL